MEAPLIATDRLAHVPEKIRSILVEVKQDLTAYYGDRLQKVLLYGSYARGDFHDESDIDIMPLLTYLNGSMWDEKSRLFDITYPYFEKTYISVSVLPATLENFTTSDKFFFRFVRKDAIEL